MPGTATPAPSLEATFACAVCGKEAARIVVVPRGGYDRVDLDLEVVVDTPRYVIDADQLGLTHALLPTGPDVTAIAAALAERDITALWELNPEYVPMWCPPCRAVYCADEWTLWQVWADDLPDWFEELRGRCPVGHERQIYD